MERVFAVAEHLWAVVVQQAFVFAVVEILLVIVFVAGNVFALVWLYKRTSRDCDHEVFGDEGTCFVLWVLAVFLSVWVGLAVLSAVYKIATALINPEYWAITTLLK